MRRVPTTFVLVLFLFGGILRAGVEPSPFLPQIQRLEAIEHVLLVTYANEDRILSSPPETQPPPRPLAVQLNAIRFHLALEETQIVRVVTPVLDEGLAPEEIVPALEAIGSAVKAIQSRAVEGFTYPPDDPEVLEALSDVEAQAGSVVNTTETFLPSTCPCWSEEEIAYSTGDSGALYVICVLDETRPGSLFDYLLWEGWDEWGANISFTADSQYVDGVSSPPYWCAFGHNDWVPEWENPIWRQFEITQEEYEACAASIAQQATVGSWPDWCQEG